MTEPSQASQAPNHPPSSIVELQLPTSISQWVTLADNLGCRQKTLNGLFGNKKTPESRPQIKSASEITQEQFACMRTVWPNRRKIDVFPANRKFKERAREELASWPAFQAYLQTLREPTSSPNLEELGPFALFKMRQDEIPTERSSKRKAPDDERKNARQIKRRKTLESDQKDDSTSSSGDERRSAASDPSMVPSIHIAASQSELKVEPALDKKIVSQAVIFFLLAIESRFHHRVCHWSPAHNPFMQTDFGINVMTARNDGFLKATNSPEIFAIIDAKPDSRNRTSRPKVLWQETAEMVAWFMHDEVKSQKPHRYFLVSADRHQLFLTTAEKHPEYMAYLKDRSRVRDEYNLSENSFLIMQEYGPWNISHEDDMKDFAEVMLSIAYEAEEALKGTPGE